MHTNSAYTQELKIELHDGNENEKKAKELVVGFLKEYDLGPYLFTKTIKIQSNVVPHSHPTLTLNTRTISKPDHYLALFLHEQIHWFFSNPENNKKLESFIHKIKLKYPKIPTFKDGGASNEHSTYLHFGVCFYELEILSKLIGVKKAEEVFANADVYFWIKREILKNREFVKKSLIESKIIWKDANSTNQVPEVKP